MLYFIDKDISILLNVFSTFNAIVYIWLVWVDKPLPADALGGFQTSAPCLLRSGVWADSVDMRPCIQGNFVASHMGRCKKYLNTHGGTSL